MAKKFVKRTDANNETLYFYTHSDVVDVGEGNATTSLTNALNSKASASDVQALSDDVLRKSSQTLSNQEKEQVHNNLSTESFIDDRAVRYDEPQVLGSDEKAQALTNLGLNGVDEHPTKNSTNMVRSGGIAEAIDDVQYAKFDGIQETSVTLNTTTTATGNGTVLFYIPNNAFIYKAGNTYYTLWNNTNRLTNGFYNDGESTPHALTTKIFINTIDGLPYSFNGTDFTTVAIDEEPMAGSDNVVKSGGVYVMGKEICKPLTGEINFSRYLIDKLWISGGKYNIIDGYQSCLVPINGITTIIIKTGDFSMYYAFLTDNEYSNNENAHYVEGTGRNSIVANRTYTVDIPESTNYLWVSLKNPERSYCPQSIVDQDYKTIDDKIMEVLDKENKENYYIDGSYTDEGREIYIASLFVSGGSAVKPIRLNNTYKIQYTTGTNYFLVLKQDDTLAILPASGVLTEYVILVWWRKIGNKWVFIGGKLYNDYCRNVIESNQAINSKETCLFNVNFKSGNYEAEDFLQFHGTVTEGAGNLLPSGIDNRLTANRMIVLDEWDYVVDISTTDNNEKVCITSELTQSSSTTAISLFEADFDGRQIRLYNASTVTRDPSEAGNPVKYTDVSSIINGNSYRLILGRHQGKIIGTIINKKTGQKSVVEQGQNSSSGSGHGGNAAGRFYDNPSVFVYSGSVYIESIVATCNVSPKILFVGDSITQGAHNLYSESWAMRCAEYFGNSITAGRGSALISCTKTQLTSLLKTVCPKVVVVTIGTNETSESKTKEQLVAQLSELVELIKNNNAIPIINNVCNSTERHTILTKVNEAIDQLGELGAKFNLITSVNYDWSQGANTNLLWTDGVHLSVAGNTALYEYFISTFDWLKNI